MPLIPCRDCGEEFDPEKKRYTIKAGYIDQCATCSARSMDINQKYVGRPGAISKSANIEIFRTNLVSVRGTLNRESAIGRNANINLSSAVNASAKEDDFVMSYGYKFKCPECGYWHYTNKTMTPCCYATCPVSKEQFKIVHSPLECLACARPCAERKITASEIKHKSDPALKGIQL